MVAFLLGLIGSIAGIVAMGRANNAKEQAEALKSRLKLLERELARLRRGQPEVSAKPSVEISPADPKLSAPPQLATIPLPPPAPVATTTNQEAATSAPLSQLLKATTIPKPKPDQPRSINWKSILRRLHLWPPSQTVSGEVGLAGWWTTRIGILLAVIALVFLGVYVNKQTASWIRWIELLGISLSVCVAGRWLESKVGRYGEIVSAGGLAMLFFTAFAAHGVEAVQLTSSPGLGTVLQGFVLALMLAWSLWKRDEPLAGAVFGLGYVSCWFTAHYGLAPITLGGLLLLGLASSGLLARRRWWLPAWIACFGSLGGLLLLAYTNRTPPAIQAWQVIGTVTLLLLGSLLALRLGRHREQTLRYRRRFLVAQAALATGASLVSLLLIDVDQLSLLYAALAATSGIYAWTAYQQFKDEALFQTFFLKSATFLALVVVSEFDGPTRWITLAAQALGVLWTMRRSTQQCRWLEVAFVGLWLCSYGLFLNDAQLLEYPAGRLTAWVYLPFATLIATLYHQGWAQGIKTTIPRYLAPIMSALAGFGWILSNHPLDSDILRSVVYLAVTLGMLGLERWRNYWTPLITGAIAAVIGLALHAEGSARQLTSFAGIVVMLALIASGFHVAQRACLMHANRGWLLRCFVTVVWILASLRASWALAQATSSTTSPHLGVLVYVGLTATILMTTSLLLAQRKIASVSEDSHAKCRATIAILLGLSLAVFGWFEFSPQAFPIGMFLVTCFVLTVSLCRRDSIACLALVAPALACVITYDLASLRTVNLWTVGGDALLGMVLVASLITGAWQLYRRSKVSPGWAQQILDGILHLASLSIVYQFAERHLNPSMHWLAMALLVWGVLGLAKSYPFHVLRYVAWAPALAMLISSLADPLPLVSIVDRFSYAGGAVVLLLAWCFERRQEHPHSIGNRTFIIAAGGVLWATFTVCQQPWLIPALSVVSMTFTLLWRWLRDPVLAYGGVVTATIALLVGFDYLSNPLGYHHSIVGLMAILTAVALTITQGWLLASWTRHPRYLGGSIITWMHALAPLALALIAMVTPSLGKTDLATVGWGLTSISLFVAGLILGLKPFRIAGLLGLLACVIRVFSIDLQDTFYRIIAFAVTALVLLLIGYLYTRFRERIEAHDHA